MQDQGQRSHAFGAPTSTPGHTDVFTRGYLLLPTGGTMLMFLTAVHEQEREQEAFSHVIDLSRNEGIASLGPEDGCQMTSGDVS